MPDGDGSATTKACTGPAADWTPWTPDCNSPYCGQPQTSTCQAAVCNGTQLCTPIGGTRTQSCSNSSCGEPGPPTNQFPSNGGAPNEYITNSSSINLAWGDPVPPNNNFTTFPIRISDNGAPPEMHDLPVGQHLYAYAGLVSGHVYNWWIHAYNSVFCNGVTGSSCNGAGNDGLSGSVGGYFCYEGQQCTLPCGQAKDCPGNGSCASTLCGDPNDPINPVPDVGTTHVVFSATQTVSWQDPLSGSAFDKYQIVVNDRTAHGWSGGTSVPCPTGMVNGVDQYCGQVNNTDGANQSLTFPTNVGAGLELTPGHLYRWWAQSYKSSNCNGLGTCSSDNGYSPTNDAGGMFCRETEMCTVQCGQNRQCAGAVCGQADCGDPNPPRNPDPAGTELAPMMVNGSNATLRWDAPLGGSSFDLYKIRVNDKTAAAWNGCATPNDPETLCVNVANTVNSYVYPPSTNLVAGHLYHWWVHAFETQNCGGTGPVCASDDGYSSPIEGYFKMNQQPSFQSLVIKNKSNTVIVPETGNRNHICDNMPDRVVKIVVNATDPDGATDLDRIDVRLGAGMSVGITGMSGNPPGTPYITGVGVSWADLSNKVSLTTSGNGIGLTAVFNIAFAADYSPTSLNNFEVGIGDSWYDTGWIDTGRAYKVWSCKVPVQGTLFDASATNRITCPDEGYSDPYPGSDFQSLTFQELEVGTQKVMNVTAPTYDSGAGGQLTWGSRYFPIFDLNTLNAADPAMSPFRTDDLGVVGENYTCEGGDFRVGQYDAGVNKYVDPYTPSPGLLVDFSAIKYQDPWFQSRGGGLMSRRSIYDGVPITCANGGVRCTAAVSATSVTADNGVVIAPAMRKNSNCLDQCHFGDPNDWYARVNAVYGSDDYTTLYNNYYVKLGVGVTYPGLSTVTMSQIMSNVSVGGTGVVFVKGGLNVDTDVTVLVGKFLMVISKGNIQVGAGVNRMDGVYLTDGDITISDESDTPLEVNGTLVAGGSMELSRGYLTHASNNSSPAIRINSRPDFIFNMPGKLTDVITGWQEGGE